MSPNHSSPDPETQEAKEELKSIDCSNHSNVLSVLLQEYLNSLSQAKDGGSAGQANPPPGPSVCDSPRVVHL